MADEIAMDQLRSWIGKQDHESDTLTPELLKRFRATLGGYTELGSSTPLGIHWCLALPALSKEDLGDDGHPSKGGFLPPVPLPRRMWASSKIRFHKPMPVGVAIERTSTIKDVVLKQSDTSGELVFVHVDHVFSHTTEQGIETLIEDTQTIVYREPSSFKAAKPEERPVPAYSHSVRPDSTLLSRYSGLTFNGHRIHYDHNYATAVEGYPALVVHGPLMATLLMNLAQARQPNHPIQAFEFRGAAPAFVDQDLLLICEDDSAESLEVRTADGALITRASAQFASSQNS